MPRSRSRSPRRGIMDNSPKGQHAPHKTRRKITRPTQRKRSRERSKERSKDRDRSRDRDRDRERDRSRDRDRHRRHRRSRSRSPRRRRSRSRSRERRFDRNDRDRGRRDDRDRRGRDDDDEEVLVFQKEDKPAVTEEQILALPEEDQDLMRTMGFAGFDTTKDKQVVGNDLYAANIAKKRRYSWARPALIADTVMTNETETSRQYMNRKGGFNRPLDFIP